MRIGIHRAVPIRPITAQNEGQWERLADGLWRWRLQLDVPGAVALRVHFTGLERGGTLTASRDREASSRRKTPADREPAGVPKNRYLSFIPGNPGRATAISMKFVSLQHPEPPNDETSPPPDSSGFDGVAVWVGPPETFLKKASTEETFQASRLQCDPYFQE